MSINRFYLFRSNIKELEYYHKYKDLYEFERYCHDFYMLFPMELLRNDIMDEVVIYRFSDIERQPIQFEINSKPYTQKWIRHLDDIFKDPSATMTFWRGGFTEYDNMINKNPKFFGRMLYLAASKRIVPTNNKYDNVLIESDNDSSTSNSKPFYKTVNPNIFKPLNLKPEYDLCWICNFSQISQKGQEWFIKKISESKRLRKLKILHLGNNPSIGAKLSTSYGINNITFADWKPREEINEYLNKSRFGIVTSNMNDGCPRTSTEILGSGTPLLVRDQTRLLSYYKTHGVVVFSENPEETIINSVTNYDYYKQDLLDTMDTLSMKTICMKNFDLWF